MGGFPVAAETGSAGWTGAYGADETHADVAARTTWRILNGSRGETRTVWAIMPPWDDRRCQRSCSPHLHITSRTMEKPSKSISFHPTCCTTESRLALRKSGKIASIEAHLDELDHVVGHVLYVVRL